MISSTAVYLLWSLSIVSAGLILAQVVSSILTTQCLKYCALWMKQSNHQHFKNLTSLSDQLHLSLLALEGKTIFQRLSCIIFEKKINLFLRKLSDITPDLKNPSVMSKSKMRVADAVWELNSILGGEKNRHLILKSHGIALILLTLTVLKILGLSLSSSHQFIDHNLITFCQILWPITLTWGMFVMHGSMRSNIASLWQQASNQCFQVMLDHMPPPLPIMDKTHSTPKKEQVYEKSFN